MRPLTFDQNEVDIRCSLLCSEIQSNSVLVSGLYGSVCLYNDIITGRSVMTTSGVQTTIVTLQNVIIPGPPPIPNIVTISSMPYIDPSPPVTEMCDCTLLPQIGPIPPAKSQNVKPKLKVKIRLSLHGLLSLESAQVGPTHWFRISP